MTLKASFIGLGSMGSAMAANLLKAGVDLAVYNRSIDKSTSLVNSGAKLLKTPNEAFKHAPIIFSMVANDQALEDISLDLLKGAYDGCIHVSCSTVAPETIKKLHAKHQEKGGHLVSAPVFGKPDVAIKHELWIALAGNATAKEQIIPYLNFLSKKVYDFGETPESANAVKVAGNFMILSVVEMLAEGFAFAEKNGVAPNQFHAFLTDSIFPSPVFQNYGKLIIDKKFTPAGFKMTLGLKDLNLFLNAAKALNVTTPFAEVLKKQLDASLEKGRENMDWSAISLLNSEE